MRIFYFRLDNLLTTGIFDLHFQGQQKVKLIFLFSQIKLSFSLILESQVVSLKKFNVNRELNERLLILVIKSS
jgi:hypothetical protein